MILPVIAGLLGGGAPLELDAYLRKPNPAKAWSVKSRKGDRIEASLTSQEWQGKKWVHDLLIVKPKKPLGGEIAILYITGDRVNRADLPFIERLANEARMPVVTIFNVPNQPLYEKTEDALIAHTFGAYLQTGDASWPLLFPMTKAALSALDAAEAISGYKKFVVCGGSKRGWTTWFTGVANDKRIKGIAPMVYDNLNMPAQLKHQMEYYGRYSEMIGDYTESGLTEVLNTEAGKKLAAMVDPYSYLSRLAVPVLAVVGSNDRYWTVDSHTLYWDAIKTKKCLSIVPNQGHNLGDGKQATAAIAFFARACLGTLPGGLPVDQDKREIAVARWVGGTKGLRDFRETTFTVADSLGGSGTGPVFFAMFTNRKLKADGLEATFSTPVRVIRL